MYFDDAFFLRELHGNYPEITQEDTLTTVSAYDVVYERTDSGYQQIVLVSPLMERYDGDDPYTNFSKVLRLHFMTPSEKSRL